MTFVNLIFSYCGENEKNINDSETMIIGFKKDQNCNCKHYEECNQCKCKCGYFDSDTDSDTDECDKPDDCLCLKEMFYECFLHPFENGEFINKIIYLLGTNIKYNYDKHYYYNPNREDDMKVYDVTPDDKANFRLQTINFLSKINNEYDTNITRWVQVVGEW